MTDQNMLANWDRITGKGKYFNKEVSEQELADQILDPSKEDTQALEAAKNLEGSETKVDTTPKPKGEKPDHDWEKRAADKERYIAQLKEQLVEAEKKVTAKEAAEEELNRMKEGLLTEAQLEEMAKKNPDVYKLYATLAYKNRDQLTKVTEKQLEPVIKTLQAQAVDKAMKEIVKAHPDAKTLVESPEFLAWRDTQSVEVRALFESSDPKTVIRAFDVYKSEVGENKEEAESAKDKNKAREDNASSPASKPKNPSAKEKRQWTAAQVKALSQTEWAKVRDDVYEAMADGRYSE